MTYSTLTSSAIVAFKLQVSLNNIQSQLKLEKFSYLAKDTKIKSLEYLMIKLGYDPSDVKVVEEMIKRIFFDILALRIHLNSLL